MMFARYMHMLSWGLLYAAFSVMVCYLYRALNCTGNSVAIYMGKKKLGRIYYADVMVYLIITTISAIRLNTGSDFYNYYIYFNQVKEKYTSVKEILIQPQSGYSVLSWIIKSFTDYEFAIFVVIAVLSYAYLFHLLRSEIDDTPCALLCYMFLGYYAYSNNILKQYIAMTFIMCAYLNHDRKKPARFVLFVVFATWFHYSALFVVIVMYLVRRMEPSFGKYWMSVTGGIGIGLAVSHVLSFAIRLIPSAAGYEKYISWRRSGQFRLIAAVAGMCVIYMILTFVILKYKENVKTVNEKRYQEIIFLIIGLGINLVAVRQWIINRMAIYFYQFIILILPTMFSGIEPKKRKKLKTYLYFAMFLYMIFSSIFLGENEYYSYNTVFSGDTVISDVQYNIIHGWSR